MKNIICKNNNCKKKNQTVNAQVNFPFKNITTSFIKKKKKQIGLHNIYIYIYNLKFKPENKDINKLGWS